VVGWLWRRQPYLFVGWLWFLGMLVPVLGLVGHFLQGRADNYTYLSQIGLSIAVAWGVAAAVRAWRSKPGAHAPAWLLPGLAAASVIALAATSWVRTGDWRTTEAVWTRTVAATPNNSIAHYCLARVYVQQGKIPEATAECRQAVAQYTIGRHMIAEAHVLLGECLGSQGKPVEALREFQDAVQIDPLSDLAHSRLAIALIRGGRLDDAIAEFREAARLNPGQLDHRIDLANALLAKRQLAEAIELCREVLQIDPHAQRAKMVLEQALSAERKTRGASP